MVRTAGHIQTNQYVGIVQSLQHMIKHEGVRSLWNGNGANCLRVIPNYGLRFMFNDRSREFLVNWKGKSIAEPLSRSELFLAGAMAGTGQITITYPFEVIFTRLAVSGSKLHTGPKYRGIVDCFLKTVTKEGPRALYNGYLVTLFSGTPYVALQMSVYEALHRMMPKAANGDPPILAKLSCGSMAVIIAQTATFPGDVVRKRMQSDGMGGQKKAYSGVWNAMKTIYQKEGWRAFFDGLKVNTWRCIPEGAIMFVTFDAMKKFMNISQYDKK